MSSYILCSPQHAFLGVIGLLMCGLFTAHAIESSPRGAESLARFHQESHALSASGTSIEGGALATADVPHYYR
ncbi:MAG: hypothetical protein ABJE95_26200 [Byssovorax sp.]